MKQSPGRLHPPSRLSASLDQRLNWYAVAAGAAGVSLLALAQPSEARIVYTKTHKVIGSNGIYGLDLNHDGTVDFVIQQRGYPFAASGYNSLAVKAAFGNAVEGSARGAGALGKGSPIGPRQQFVTNTSSNAVVMYSAGCGTQTSCHVNGQWGNVSDRFLGLKFQIAGKAHYGWARLSVAVQPANHKITATLNGYAYETIANKGIRAGQTASEAGGPQTDLTAADSVATVPVAAAKNPQRATLGRLARGVSNFSSRRMP